MVRNFFVLVFLVPISSVFEFLLLDVNLLVRSVFFVPSVFLVLLRLSSVLFPVSIDFVFVLLVTVFFLLEVFSEYRSLSLTVFPLSFRI